MHRIFTRVFLSFWLAIVLITTVSVAVTAINFNASDRDPSTATRQAAEILQREGLTGLRAWLAARNKRVRDQRTLIVDSSGHDILGQKLPHNRPWPGLPSAPHLEGHERSPNEIGAPTASGGPRRLNDSVSASAFDSPPEPLARRSAGVLVPSREAFADFGAPSVTFFFPRPPDFRWLPGGLIRAADGSAFRLIFDPPLRRGPFSPPFSWSARGALLALAVAISGLISYLLARSIASPLQTLQSATRSLSTGDLSTRSGEKVARRKDEFGTLAREFDSMAERLSALIVARQRLLRDISHELRSPVARLQMALQLLRQDPSSSASQLDRIERESVRLEVLINQVLEYARLERDSSTLKLEEVDFIDLVRQIVYDTAFERQSEPDRFWFTYPKEPIFISADSNLLHAAVNNVVRNALIHGGDSSPIEIAITSNSHEVTLAVRDRGPGVPEAELQKIFEPFYRVVDTLSNKARNEGSGIGLAIASRAVALHGGHISAHNMPEGGLGLKVTIALPLNALSRVAG